MSDLLASLSSAARALDAQRLGLDVTGQNIANVNTVGYTRRTVEFAEVPPVSWNSAGNGVEAVRVRAIRSDLIDAQLRHEQSPQGRESAIFESLSRIEAALGTAGRTLDSSLTDFYDSFTTLAQDPTSGAARVQVAVQGQSLAAAFNDTAARLSSAQVDEDQQVRATVDQVNALAQRIASLNAALSSGSSAGESIRDDLGVALKSLSALVDIGVVTRADGGADVSIGNGRGLVIGANAYAVDVASSGPSGFASLTSGTFAITSEITGGRLGGLLQARDVLAPDYMRRLDQLAYGVATSVNGLHQAGYDLNGTAGGAFFAPPGAVSGTAATLSMNAAVVADPRLIAAAGTPAAGDNQNARALAMLRQTTIPGGTANSTDTWGALVYRVGTDTQVAKNEQASRDEIMQQLEALRDQASAVSLDEEAANLMKFQRAYEANAKFFSAVDRSLDTLMQMIGA